MIKRFILCGPGASGKDHFRKRLIEAKGLVPDVSFTTRAPRQGEVDGVDYKFVDQEKFELMMNINSLYEHVLFNGNYYGTQFYSWIHSDVFIMTPEGISQISKEDRSESLIYYFNPEPQVIALRLADRGMKFSERFERMQADKEEFKDFTDYDILITNPDF